MDRDSPSPTPRSVHENCYYCYVLPLRTASYVAATTYEILRKFSFLMEYGSEGCRSMGCPPSEINYSY